MTSQDSSLNNNHVESAPCNLDFRASEAQSDVNEQPFEDSTRSWQDKMMSPYNHCNNPPVGFSPGDDFHFVTMEPQCYNRNEKPLLPNSNPINTFIQMANEGTNFGSQPFSYSPLLPTHPADPCKMTSQDSSLNNNNVESAPRNLDIGASEAQSDVNEQPSFPNHNHINTLSPTSNKTKKRKQEKAKEKSTKKRQQTLSVSESTASQPQPKPKRKKRNSKEFIKENSVERGVGAVKNRVDRQIKNDKMEEMRNAISLFCNIFKKAPYPLSTIVYTLEQIGTQWPVRSDLQDILIKIKKIKHDYKKAVLAKDEVAEREAKRRLEEVGEELLRVQKQRQEDAIKGKNLEAIFTSNEEVRDETLRKALSEAFPWFVLEETATNGPTTVDQNQPSLGILEQLQATFRFREMEIYAEGNNQVGLSDFPGLEEALKKLNWVELPDYLQPIASKIEKPIGSLIIQALVCAAIQEMENLSVENLNWDRVKRWGATLNMAKKQGVQVEFAYDLLKKNFYAYCGYLASKVV